MPEVIDLEKEPLNIDEEPILWEEAAEITQLLPVFELNNVHISLVADYFNPNRKSKVLQDYIELAFEDGHEIDPTVIETLHIWQKNPSKKRSRSQPSELDTAKKLRTEEVAHCSKKKEKEQQKSDPTSLHSIFRTKYDSFPPHHKNWIDSKIKFLLELIPSMKHEDILAEIVSCADDREVEGVTLRLLESEAQNEVPKPKPSTSSQEQPPEEPRPSTSGENNNLETTMEENIEEHLSQLTDMFADADPDYLASK